MMLNAKRRRRIRDRVKQKKSIKHLVKRARNLRWMPDEMTYLKKEYSERKT